MTVKQIQALLTYLGYNPGGVDGVTGVKTVAAVKVFQSVAGLTVDGVAGAETQAALLTAVEQNQLYSASSAEVTTEVTSDGDFWGGIKYFTREEFRCQCGGKYCNGYPAEPQEKLIRIAERMREDFGVPVTVSSGLRCAKHNAEVGGVSNSRHLTGKAMDFCVKGKTATQILAWTKAQSDLRYSYAINGSYVHMDVE